MIEGRTDIKRAFISGTTRRVRFQIIDTDTGLGFQPDTLILSIYDVVAGSGAWVTAACPYHVWPVVDQLGPAVTSSIINGQNDVDISAFVDTTGHVDLFLAPEDTAVEVPAHITAFPARRVLLFTWTWDGSPIKTAKLEIVLSIAPDRETVAT